ncbi:hypothetical protein Tco_0518970 [Tanacetum coccineum]
MLTHESRPYYDGKQKFALGYENPFNLKKAPKHNPKLYHVVSIYDPSMPAYVRDYEKTLQLATESRVKMKETEIKPINYTKLNNLYDHFVPQTKFSDEQMYCSNEPKTDVVPFKKIFQNENVLSSEFLKKSHAKRYFATFKDDIRTIQSVELLPSPLLPCRKVVSAVTVFARGLSLSIMNCRHLTLLSRRKSCCRCCSHDENLITAVAGALEFLEYHVVHYRICAKLGREEVKPVSKKITMLDHSKVEPMGILKDVLCQVSVTIILAKFLILDIPVDKDVPIKGDGDGKWHAKVRIIDPYGNVYDQGNRPGKKIARKYAALLCFKAWRRGFDINEPIYTELCHEFYSTYEFDEVVTDDELMTKKLIKFRLGGHGHTLTLLKFAQRLSLYHAAKINEEGFEVYFQGGLRSNNARDYWLSISSEEELHLSRSLASTIRSPILRVLQKMITYGLCQRTTGMAKRMGLLTNEVLNGLSALTFCRALDATTLRELIDSNGRLIVEDPAPGVPRVAMPRPPRTSMQDLYDGMGNMEIRQGVLERMTDRQSYQFDKYDGVFEYMVGQHGVLLQGAYAPPGYHEEQHED